VLAVIFFWGEAPVSVASTAHMQPPEEGLNVEEEKERG
jgi:hypothetical protein